MKKLLLSFTLFTTHILASAQSELVIYSGDIATDFFNVKPYTFDGLLVKDTLLSDQNQALFLKGSTTNYYAGGFGNSGYNSSGAIPLGTVYNGDFAKTKINFDAKTSLLGARINIDLFNLDTPNTYPPKERWHYEFDICPALPCPTSFSALLSDFWTLDETYNPTGTKMTSSDFGKINQFHFNTIVTSPSSGGNVTIIFDNLILSDKDIITTLDETTQLSNNENVSVFDSMGRFVANGKYNDLHLESGKIYLVRSGNKARKLIIN